MFLWVVTRQDISCGTKIKTLEITYLKTATQLNTKKCCDKNVQTTAKPKSKKKKRKKTKQNPKNKK